MRRRYLIGTGSFAAYRDVLRGVATQEGSDDDDLEPVIEETDGPSQRLGTVWTDGLSAYRGTEHDHRYVARDDRYLSDEGTHTN